MEFSFDTKRLRDICENDILANEELGISTATELRKRLSDLRAAQRIKDVFFAESTNDEQDLIYKINLKNNFRLIFCANHVKNPKKDGVIDWSKVSRVKILNIEKQ